MSTDHETRLTLCNRQLVRDLAEVRLFLRELTSPDGLGHAVSPEVRARARALLKEAEEPCASQQPDLHSASPPHQRRVIGERLS